MRKLSIIFLTGVLSVGVFSCKRTLDVNTNPNDPADVPVEVLLPSAQSSISTQLGNYFQVVGGLYAQYWTQNPNASQYRSLEQYSPDPTTADRAWGQLYAGALTDLQIIIDKADGKPATQSYAGIARILQGFTFQLLTDNFGDIPFTEALKGQAGVVSPKFDRQEVVYMGIIDLVKKGRDEILDDNPVPGSEDLIYGSNAIDASSVLWRKFANTLLLRMYLRMSNVAPGVAQQGIQELGNNPDGFLTDGQTGQISYLSDPGNTNPLYSEIVGLSNTQNFVASSTGLDTLFNSGDPRIDVFYNTPPYNGLAQGFYETTSPGPFTYPGVGTGALANPGIYGYAESDAQKAPVKFISSYESYFLQAEAVSRGWLSAANGTAEDLYGAGIAANFSEYGVQLPDSFIFFNAFPAAGSEDEQIGAIITQKWIAMNGNQNIEAWTEWRRTGYPDFFTVSEASRLPAGVFPARLPYPSTEVTNNRNFPGQKAISDRVWWDVN